jgi:aldose 1-epimerase
MIAAKSEALAMSELALEHGAWRARVLPEAGGLIAALDCAGVAVLRPMAAGSTNPLDAACFPMVPWCNRIAGARFRWGNGLVFLSRNFLPEPHAIHGHGWQSAWTVIEQITDRCVMVHRHDGAAPGWPWPYEAHQEIVLDGNGCTITLSLTNQSAQMMPAGLGLHPYLRRRPESRVAFAARALAEVGADLIPTGQSLAPGKFGDFAAQLGAALPDALIDHCFTGWDGVAMVRDDCGAITLNAKGASHLHLYAPTDPAILCLEPASDLPDAANTGAMRLCVPGETVSLTLRIGVA